MTDLYHSLLEPTINQLTLLNRQFESVAIVAKNPDIVQEIVRPSLDNPNYSLFQVSDEDFRLGGKTTYDLILSIFISPTSIAETSLHMKEGGLLSLLLFGSASFIEVCESLDCAIDPRMVPSELGRNGLIEPVILVEELGLRYKDRAVLTSDLEYLGISDYRLKPPPKAKPIITKIEIIAATAFKQKQKPTQQSTIEWK